jgi:hypothetical protein
MDDQNNGMLVLLAVLLAFVGMIWWDLHLYYVARETYIPYAPVSYNLQTPEERSWMRGKCPSPMDSGWDRLTAKCSIGRECCKIGQLRYRDQPACTM